jgi:hypothetical protein
VKTYVQPHLPQKFLIVHHPKLFAFDLAKESGIALEEIIT